MIRTITVAFIIFFLCGLHLSCNQRDVAGDAVNVMSPDVKGDLVFFFKEGTPSDQILEFHRTVTGIPSPNGTGHSFLPGMMSSVRVIVNGFEGESIKFFPAATEEQKAFVKKRVSESPLIHKVYENVIPSRINDL